MIRYGTTPKEEQDKRDEWKWFYAYVPTKVGFDADGRIITVYKERYQGRGTMFFGCFPAERQLPGVTVRTWDLFRSDCQLDGGYY